jgi:hypothetical protein
MSYGGVPADELRCPTCGCHFTDFNMRSDPVEFDVTLDRAISRVPATPWYILCPMGHKWTVKTIWRTLEEPDDVLLGEYLGDAFVE